MISSVNTTETITVKTQSHDYPILIAAHLDYAQTLCHMIRGKQVLIVSNETIAPLYLASLKSALKSASESVLMPEFQVYDCILPDGEVHKHQKSINHIYDVLMTNGCNRDVTLIALGGGVVGDMTGFAAASFMRGVDFIQIPTTLLAQVDSSVGGKTGINHELGKNMIGAFWQPRLVLAQMDMLKTLPKRELAAGMAEVIKYALIMDLPFLGWLEDNMAKLMALDGQALSFVVKKCCELKAQIVAEDEKEAGRRAILNFGHTFGHVIETHQGYGNWLHGEAVAVGMLQAAIMSHLLGWIKRADVQRIYQLILSAGLPVEAPDIAADTAIELMGHDKKTKSGQIRLILLKTLGDATLTQAFSTEQLQQVLTTKIDVFLHNA